MAASGVLLAQDERRLALAVLVSLAIHVTALTVVPELRSRPQKEPEPLLVDLVPLPPPPKIAEPPPEPAPPQPAPPIESLPEPVVEPPPRIEEPKPKPKPKVIRKKEPPKVEMPKIEPAEPDAAPAESDPLPVLPPVIATPPQPEVAESPVFKVPEPAIEPPPKIAEPSPAPEEIQSGYEKEISRSVDRYKRYPAIARQRYWEGLVRIVIDINADGKVGNISVTQSSGHEVLDRSALAAVKSAQPFPPAPKALWGSRINLPISFVLTEK
jgi:protein TonB